MLEAEAATAKATGSLKDRLLAVPERLVDRFRAAYLHAGYLGSRINPFVEKDLEEKISSPIPCFLSDKEFLQRVRRSFLSTQKTLYRQVSTKLVTEREPINLASKNQELSPDFYYTDEAPSSPDGIYLQLDFHLPQEEPDEVKITYERNSNLRGGEALTRTEAYFHNNGTGKIEVSYAGEIDYQKGFTFELKRGRSLSPKIHHVRAAAQALTALKLAVDRFYLGKTDEGVALLNTPNHITPWKNPNC